MGYSINLNRISVTQYKEHLLSIELLPSRRLLLDNIDSHFSVIAACGINDIGALLQAVSTPKKLADLCEKTKISEDYLKILKREIGSLACKSVSLAEFDMLMPNVIDKLNKAGIRSAKDYYEAYPNIDSSIINQSDQQRLYALCSLVSVNGIGPLAAKLFFEAGYSSAADIASGDPAKMAAKVNAVNNEKLYYGGQLGEKDMTFCIVYAQLLEKYA